MDREFVVKNNIIDRYVRGELDSELEAEFEKFYLQDSVTLEQLDSLILPQLQTETPDSSRLPLLSASMMIALLVVGIAIGVATSTWMNTNQKSALGHNTLIVELNRNQPHYSLTLDPQYSNQRVVLGVPVDAVDGTGSLTLSNGYQDHPFAGLQVNDDGYVYLDLPASYLKPGLWHLHGVDLTLAKKYHIQVEPPASR